MAISDLSRLRDRWIRLENQIAKLDRQIEDSDPDERQALALKREQVENRLKTTQVLVGWEEKRLLNPDSKLLFRPRRLRNSAPALQRDLI